MLQHHKIEEKRTAAHSEQTPPRAKGERPCTPEDASAKLPKGLGDGGAQH